MSNISKEALRIWNFKDINVAFVNIDDLCRPVEQSTTTRTSFISESLAPAINTVITFRKNRNRLKLSWMDFEKMIANSVEQLPLDYVKFMDEKFDFYWDGFGIDPCLDNIAFLNTQLGLLCKYAIVLCWAYNDPPCQSRLLQFLFKAKKEFMNSQILLD